LKQHDTAGCSAPVRCMTVALFIKQHAGRFDFDFLENCAHEKHEGMTDLIFLSLKGAEIKMTKPMH